MNLKSVSTFSHYVFFLIVAIFKFTIDFSRNLNDRILAITVFVLRVKQMCNTSVN